MAFNWKTIEIFAQSGTAVSHTGNTDETTLFTKTLPSRMLGPNDCIRVNYLASITNSANDKTIRVKLGSTAYVAVVYTATLTVSRPVLIYNRNSMTSQVAYVDSDSDGVGNSTAAIKTGTEDCTTPLALSITGQLENSGETITLEAFTVEILRGGAGT